MSRIIFFYLQNHNKSMKCMMKGCTKLKEQKNNDGKTALDDEGKN